MQLQESLTRIRKSTGIEDPDVAKRLIMSSLETLGELLPKAERIRIGAPLSRELREAFTSDRSQDTFTLEEFYNRISSRTDLGYPEAKDGAMAVMQLIRETMGPNEIKEIQRSLPDGFQELFSGRPKGPLSPSA